MTCLGIHCIKHHGGLHIAASWFPVHCVIALDGAWTLLDAQRNHVRIHFACYRLISQSVLVLGRFSFRIDRKPKHDS